MDANGTNGNEILRQVGERFLKDCTQQGLTRTEMVIALAGLLKSVAAEAHKAAFPEESDDQFEAWCKSEEAHGARLAVRLMNTTFAPSDALLQIGHCVVRLCQAE